MTKVEEINCLEQQILVHSIIYYRLGESIWTDQFYDKQAKKLKGLIEEYPEEFKQSILYDTFKGFDWVSGYDLPLYHPHYTNIAVWLLNYHKKKGD